MRRPGGPTRKQQQSQDTRERLIAAAKELFAEYGYNAVSVTDIARAAGVSHGMINVYFNAKAGLLYHIIHESSDAQAEAAQRLADQDGSVMDRLRGIITAFAAHDLADPALLAVMQSYFWTWPAETETENREQLARALEPVALVLRSGVANRELASDTDVALTVQAIFALYTMGLRPAIYDKRTKEDCIDAIMAQINLLLHRPRG